MTNVNTTGLTEEDLQEIYERFNTLVAKLDTSNTSNFFSALLGPEEKIMLTKRLAAVVMYTQGFTSYRISHVLAISPSTSDRIWQDYKAGRYKGVIDTLKRQKADYTKFWKTLEVISRGGLPSIADPWRTGFGKD